MSAEGVRGIRRGEAEGVPTYVLYSPWCEVEVAPPIGGRIVRLVNRRNGEDPLWRNPHVPLALSEPGAAYDPVFYGGIDELLPSDPPEQVNGCSYPDHGELWSAALDAEVQDETLVLRGALPRCGLTYERRMRLADDAACVESAYRIANAGGAPCAFMWRMHAALTVQPGYRVVCPARWGRALDAAHTRQPDLERFAWDARPEAGRVPAADGTCEDLVLEGLEEGRVALVDAQGRVRFAYVFDLAVFPCVVVFASYGGFHGCYTVVLEPSTASRSTVAASVREGTCSRLEPGAVIETAMRLHIGEA